jgi:hypothetical protein
MSEPTHEAEARRYFARLAQALTVLGLCAIPLEALHATELDGKALSDEVKDGIREAVAALRAFMAGPK